MNASLLDDLRAQGAPRIEPLSVEQYHRMVATGVLAEGEPIELIDGLLVRKDRSTGGGDAMTVGFRHMSAVTRLLRLVARVREHHCHLRTQGPITLSARDEPEPDGVVVAGTDEDYEGRHPASGEVLLAIEVSDSSLAYDRRTKQRLYATAGIPAYLIVNLVDDRLELSTHPSVAEGRYLDTSVAVLGQTLRLPLGAASLELAAADLIPPRKP